VRRSRKLEERCLSDHLFIYLVQWYTPDHRTISDFRKNNLKEIEEALEMMKEEEKEKINLTDRDANHMKPGGSKDIRPGYNGQAAVTESGIIGAAEAVTDANDRKQL